MDTQTLKEEIAWYHGCIAGLANLDEPDASVMAHLVRELEACRVRLERTVIVLH